MHFIPFSSPKFIRFVHLLESSALKQENAPIFFNRFRKKVGFVFGQA
jgi:hypothetical protein